MSQLIIHWKVSQRLLSPWEQLIFEKFLAIDHLGPREKTSSIAKQVSNKPCRPSKKVSWTLFCSIKWEKKDKNLFFTGKIACFFFKNCVFNNLSSPEEIIFNFNSNCYNTLWTVISVPGGFSQLIIRLKVSQKLLSPWGQLIFENFLAIDLLGPREKKLSIEK